MVVNETSTMKKLILSLLLLQLTACMSFNDRSFRSTRNSIVEQMPEITLKKEFAVSLGGGLLNFLNIITLDEANISDLDHVQVAVYNVDSGGMEIDFDDLNFAATLHQRNKRLHWETIVKVREEGEQVWVLVGMDLQRNSLNAVSVFVLQHDELVLINVDGELDKMIEFALQPASDHRNSRKAG